MDTPYLRRSVVILTLVIVALPLLIAFYASETTVSAQTTESPGSLMTLDAAGKPKSLCPLKHTEVKAEISGFLSRVTVTQQFENNFNEKIEAVYTFPLPQNAAVDDMIMIVGERTVRGKILAREEALAVYEGAKSRGQVASLLDQERPNIFTQSVANILPGEQVKITISYVETLRYEDGAYEFVFPMVVGPRYIPGGAPEGMAQPSGDPGATTVADASRITPKLAAPGTRSGHDISLEVTLDAGLIVENLDSKTHQVDIERPSPSRARLKLKDRSTIPNKDFILRYDVAGRAIQDALIAHRSSRGGFFTLILQPPERVAADDVTPKELVFVLDTSGSMAGFPIEKAKETMRLALDNLYPSDTFNLITFSGDTHILFPQPVPATKGNLRKAQAFLSSTSGHGGTEMIKAIQAALEPSDNQSHVRIVCFMTDGFVGNDMGIIAEIQKHKNARVFAFGIGSSVNRFLLDNMAHAGRGDVEYVGLNDDGSAAAQRFHQRVRNPLLTDISIDWNGLPVTDIYPKRIPDLFGAKPVILMGRYTEPGSGTIRLTGKMGGNDFTREIPVSLPESMELHDVLAPLWARTRIGNLMSQDFRGAQTGAMRADLKNTITQLGLEFRLMTPFTSFVAVEEMTVTDGGQLRRIEVPVDVPEGVDPNSVRRGHIRISGGVSSRTGMFTIYDSNAIQSAQAYAFNGYVVQPAPNVGAVTTSGTNKAAGAGAGGGVGGGVGTPTTPVNTAPGVSVSSSVMPAPFPTPNRPPEELRWDRVRVKVHPTVLALINRVKKKEETLFWGSFVREGKAEVQVWFIDKSDAVRAQLKELGFEVVFDSSNSNLIVGRVPIDKVELLADLKYVRYVAPQISQ
ncbi:MAG TPA: VIT and VWA domain-containing protein [Pyrinomonadaceae bacterium]|nr:VIT and VWA domain-containing protein [Pyrinomonadaceae bacterium]